LKKDFVRKIINAKVISDFTEEELWNAYKFKYKFALTIERNNYLEKLNVYFQEAKKDLKKKS
jgi:hypothetical protein